MSDAQIETYHEVVENSLEDSQKIAILNILFDVKRAIEHDEITSIYVKDIEKAEGRKVENAEYAQRRNEIISRMSALYYDDKMVDSEDRPYKAAGAKKSSTRSYYTPRTTPALEFRERPGAKTVRLAVEAACAAKDAQIRMLTEKVLKLEEELLDKLTAPAAA